MTIAFQERGRRNRASSEAPLDAVRAALAALPEPKLHALRGVALEPTDIAPALMVWIEHATAWEVDRRSGRRYELHAPLLAIDSTQISACILALAALSQRFSRDHPEVATFFGAIVKSLDLPHTLH
jgi:hypothetical protein